MSMKRSHNLHRFFIVAILALVHLFSCTVQRAYADNQLYLEAKRLLETEGNDDEYRAQELCDLPSNANEMPTEGAIQGDPGCQVIMARIRMRSGDVGLGTFNNTFYQLLNSAFKNGMNDGTPEFWLSVGWIRQAQKSFDLGYNDHAKFLKAGKDVLQIALSKGFNPSSAYDEKQLKVVKETIQRIDAEISKRISDNEASKVKNAQYAGREKTLLERIFNYTQFGYEDGNPDFGGYWISGADGGNKCIMTGRFGQVIDIREFDENGFRIYDDRVGDEITSVPRANSAVLERLQKAWGLAFQECPGKKSDF